MTLNAIDCSNYTGALTAAQAQGLKDAGVILALVQAVDPPPAYPPGVTRQQIQTLVDAGIVVDAYIWLWFDLDVGDIQHKLSLLDGLPIRRLWLDVEDTAAKHLDQVVCEARVQAALDLCDDFPVTSWERTGVYSGRWFWAASAYMSDSEAFKDRDLWDANYDQNSDASVGFVPYGGWDHCAIKQFAGTSTLAGVPNVDLNALSDAELAKLNGGPVVDDAERAQMQAKIDSLVNSLGYVSFDLLDPVAKQKNASKAVQRLVAGIRSQADMNGIRHA